MPSIVRAEQVADNAIRLALEPGVRRVNRGDVGDALYDRGYVLEDLAGGPAPRVVWAEPEPDGSGVRLLLDQRLVGARSYRVTGSARAFTGTRAHVFGTFGPPRPRRTQHARSFDLASRPGDEGEALSTLVIDADGDYAVDAGLESLKKRVVRRVSTPLGSFRHLPDYGLRLPIKARITTAMLRDLQAQAMRQIRAEPGVLDLEVEVGSPRPGIVRFGLKVSARAGSFGETVDVEIEE